MNRRLSLPLLAATCALAFGVACAQQAAPASPQTSGTAAPAAPQPINIAITSMPGLLDPYELYNPPLGNIGKALFQQLITFDSGDPQGDLVASWRTMDPITWEFVLKDATFSNGDPVTTRDVKYAIEHGADPNNRHQGSVSTLSTIGEITIIDDRTMQIRTRLPAPAPNMPAPDPILLNRLARVKIFNTKVYEAAGGHAAEPEVWRNLAGVGGGPFMVSEFTPSQSITMVPNPRYSGEKPRSSQMTMKEIREASTRMSALQTGEVDMISNVPIDQVASLASMNAKEVVANLLVVRNISLDQNDPVFADRRVRYGLNFAVDRPKLINALTAGRATEANQMVTRETFGFNPQLPPFAFDQARARALLAEAGFPNGIQSRIGYATYQVGDQDVVQAVAAELERIGVRLELFPYDQAYFNANFFTNRVGPAFLSGFNSAAFIDPALALQFLGSTPPGNGRYRNAEFDALSRQAAAEVDRDRRRAILQQIMKLTQEDPPGIFLWGFIEFWGVNNRIEGMTVPVTGEPQLNLVSKR